MLADREMSSNSCSSDRGGGAGAPQFGRLAIEIVGGIGVLIRLCKAYPGKVTR